MMGLAADSGDILSLVNILLGVINATWGCLRSNFSEEEIKNVRKG